MRCCFNACSKVSLIYCAEPTTTHTHPFNGLFPGLPGSAGTRVAKPITYRPDALPAAKPTASGDWTQDHWRHWRIQQQLKSGTTEKPEKYKQLCSELSANSLGNPWSQSWKDTSDVCLHSDVLHESLHCDRLLIAQACYSEGLLIHGWVCVKR